MDDWNVYGEHLIMTSFLGYCNFLFLNGELDGMQLCLLYSIDDEEVVGWGGDSFGFCGFAKVQMFDRFLKCNCLGLICFPRIPG